MPRIVSRFGVNVAVAVPSLVFENNRYLFWGSRGGVHLKGKKAEAREPALGAGLLGPAILLSLRIQER